MWAFRSVEQCAVVRCEVDPLGTAIVHVHIERSQQLAGRTELQDVARALRLTDIKISGYVYIKGCRVAVETIGENAVSRKSRIPYFDEVSAGRCRPIPARNEEVPVFIEYHSFRGPVACAGKVVVKHSRCCVL